MRTDFHTILRHNAIELSREDIDKLSWDAARAYYYLNKDKWRANRPRDTRQTVCFTGFTASEKDALVTIAEGRNLRVVQSVTTDLHLLVCGPNAGPKKLEKATAQGVAIISEEDFRAYDTQGGYRSEPSPRCAIGRFKRICSRRSQPTGCLQGPSLSLNV